MGSKKVAVITVGTEITSGQIINTNAAWLANELVNLKLDVALHASVPDTESDIVELLRWAARSCDILVMTGGLGPTNDDLTRNAVAKWLEQPLEWNEPSWRKIQERLAGFGLKTPESNRQQCYFPQGTRILENEHGTANAFRAEKDGVICFVLPGVPIESMHLWETHLLPELRQLTQSADQLLLIRWHTLGKSEAEVAELVEEAIKGSGLMTGYRPHFPYIETKIWCWRSKFEAHKKSLAKVDEVLAPWLMSKDDTDIAEELLDKLPSGKRILFRDFGSQGFLATRLMGLLQKRQERDSQFEAEIVTCWGEQTRVSTPAFDLLFEIGPLEDPSSWRASLSANGQFYQETFTTPYAPRAKGRQRQYLTEKSLSFWKRILEGPAT